MPEKRDTMMPARKTDVRRLNVIRSAMGLARKGGPVPRVEALAYVLDQFEANLPGEISLYLNHPASEARRR